MHSTDPTSSPDPNGTAAVMSALDAAAAIERRLAGGIVHIVGISFAEFRLLDALARSPESRASRVGLAELVHLSPSGVTRALKPLEKLGFVTTERNERDARQALAVLTPQGHELITDARSVVDDTVAALFAESGSSQTDFLAAVDTLRSITRG